MKPAYTRAEDTLIASRILDGQYPDYKRIVPSASVLTAEFLTQELLEAVKEKFLNSSDARFNIKKKEELERVMDKIEQAIIKNNGVNFTDYDNLEAELRNAYINAMTMEGHQNIQ
jgi:DNA polymerase III sliding clamp (beta) subunit (PCNA family)